MFGFLKKKIGDAIGKLTKGIKKATKVEEVKKEVKKPVKEKPKKVVKVVEKKEEPKKKELKKPVEKKPVKKVEKKPEPKKKPIPEKKPKPKKEEKPKPKEKLAPKKIPEEKPKKIKEDIKGVKITYFVHGTTTDNEKDLATGHSPGELSKLGKQQAKDLGKKVKDKKFDVVFCSDLKRAVDSAKLGFSNYKIIQDKRLREADYGDFTQKPAKKFKSDMKKYVKTPFPNGESYNDVNIRIAEFVNELFNKYYGKHIAIVAHQAPQLALNVLLKEKSWDEAIKEDWRPKNAWKPGWDYFIDKLVPIPKKIEIKEEVKEPPKEEVVEEKPPKEEVIEEKPKKKGFFDFLKKKSKEEPKEDIEDKIEEPEVEEAVKEEPEIEKEAEELEVEEIIEEEPTEEIEEKTKKKGFFQKITETFTKVQLSEKKFEELFWDLELALLENNVAVEVIEKIKADLKEELTTGKLQRGSLQDIIAQSLTTSIDELFDVEERDLVKEIKKKKEKPYVVCMLGINGGGKTTNLAKLAYLCKNQKLTPIIAACDTFRAAAIQQLEEHANNIGVKMIKHDYGADAAAVAFDAIKHAKAKNADVVFIDTAGRLHSNTNLMDELKKIIRVTNPDIKIFVGESITGNDCVEQAQQFNEAVGIDGIILSKADVDEKGGAAVSVSYVTKKPILFLGIGQDYDDLKPFDKDFIIKHVGL